MSSSPVPIEVRPRTTSDANQVKKETSFQYHLQKVLEKLQKDPISISADDARRLHEHFDAKDERSARIISAVEALAVANLDLRTENGEAPSTGQVGHADVLTLVEDLCAAVDANPGDITIEVLKLAQSAVSKMQRAIGHTNAPHPELECELQDEYAKIEPKVEQGTVTKKEADHLHSLEARAHGHTEKGGLTAIAQSVAAKRERKASFSDASNGRDSIAAQEQSHKDKEVNLQLAELTIGPKIDSEPDKVTKEDAALVQSREARAHGQVKRDSIAAEAMSLADKNATKTAVEVN